MKWNLSSMISLFANQAALLGQSEHGLERECLRIDREGNISRLPHPRALGSALKNPYISTDFAEIQLELITPKFKTEGSAINFLAKLHAYVIKHLPNGELLWPSSIPALLPAENKIPLANYGSSHQGLQKTLYRQGLSSRYGRKMQTISGIHYNFSYSRNFWRFLHRATSSKLHLQDFINDSYFHIMRNFIRYGWITLYLFGASPAVNKSFFDQKPSALNKCGKFTCYGEFATSLRMSDYGYNSKIQRQFPISYNSLGKYVADLDYAVTTPHKAYKNIKQQLNDHILQIENEYYSPVRPKQPVRKNETVRAALQKNGLKYIEIRSLDIDPFTPIGVNVESLRFINMLISYCLFLQSPPMSYEEEKSLLNKWNQVALYGRNSIPAESSKILAAMQPLSELYDQKNPRQIYQKVLRNQQAKFQNPQLTPSFKVISQILESKECFIHANLVQSKKYQKELSAIRLNPNQEDKLQKIAEKSLEKQQEQEIHDEMFLAGYEDLEMSTQVLIREALKRGIQVEVLDRHENFIRLRKGNKIEYVKQATFTSKDTMIHYFLLNNKHIHKKILAEHKISVPSGIVLNSIREAENIYHQFAGRRIVVKPVSTNYGIGVHFIKPHNYAYFLKSLKNAFKHDKNVIVEDFIAGQEFRFLVIDYKIIGILKRLPANVIGDGIHPISQLIGLKNHDPRYRKDKKYFIRKAATESQYLQSQGLTFASIPAKNRRIFLRQNSNVATGGDPIDMTDKIPEFYQKIAINAAKSVQAKICGIDMIIENYQKKSHHAIIELNYNPAIYIHRYPALSGGVDPATPILQLLGLC